MPDAASSQAPGPIASPRRAVDMGNSAWQNSPKGSKRSGGRRKADGVNGTGA
jgi:hypothetical protein